MLDGGNELNIAEGIMDVARLLLSPQVVWGVIVTGSIWLFKKDLRALMERIAHVKVFGGEFSTRQAKSSPSGGERQGKLPQAGSEEEIPEGLNLTHEQVKEVRRSFNQERSKAYLWEYRFLNLFLVRNSQRVLDWFYSRTSPVSVDSFHSSWIDFVSDLGQRLTILEVLMTHFLIETSADGMSITPKGREYIEFRGPLV